MFANNSSNPNTNTPLQEPSRTEYFHYMPQVQLTDIPRILRVNSSLIQTQDCLLPQIGSNVFPSSSERLQPLIPRLLNDLRPVLTFSSFSPRSSTFAALGLANSLKDDLERVCEKFTELQVKLNSVLQFFFNYQEDPFEAGQIALLRERFSLLMSSCDQMALKDIRDTTHQLSEICESLTSQRDHKCNEATDSEKTISEREDEEMTVTNTETSPGSFPTTVTPPAAEFPTAESPVAEPSTAKPIANPPTAKSAIKKSKKNPAKAPKKTPRKERKPRKTPKKRARSDVKLTCQHCSTTDTPEWRKGPYPDGSICNACGLFYKKLKLRFGLDAANTFMLLQKQKGLHLNRNIPKTLSQ